MQVQRQIDKLLAQRAAEWMEALKAGGVRERREFAAWLRQSRLHVEHYLETAAIDREIAGLDASRCPDVDELIARATPHAEPLRSVPMPLVSSTRGETSQRRWKLGAGLEAGVASQADRVSTVAGEQRTLTLEDGSVVALNTRTRLRIEFSAGERAFALEAGEAVFDVAQDPLRPFIVRTPTAVVRALGTQFNVYQRPNDTVVSVIEGRVQVMPLPKGGRRAAAGEMPARTLAAGEEALVAAAGDIEARTRPDVHKVLAWRQRRLDFDEVALEDIVREFNRYGPTERLRVEGIAPGARRYGGVFDADDPESFAQLLEREKDLRVERLDGEIVISRRR
jgi:transmembrane sensor